MFVAPGATRRNREKDFYEPRRGSMFSEYEYRTYPSKRGSTERKPKRIIPIAIGTGNPPELKLRRTMQKNVNHDGTTTYTIT